MAFVLPCLPFFKGLDINLLNLNIDFSYGTIDFICCGEEGRFLPLQRKK